MYFIAVLDTKSFKYIPVYVIPLLGCTCNDEAIEKAKIIRSTLDKRYIIDIRRAVDVSIGDTL